MKAAIIIIDVLQDFFREGRLKQHRKKLVKSINGLVSIGRERDLPIIWIRQEFKDDLSDAFLALRKSGNKITIENTEGCQLLPELDRQESDHEIVKKRYSAFFKTEMDGLLGRLGVDTLIIAGVNTHACIRMAAVDAYQRDYKIILAIDCIDSYDKGFHNESLRYLEKTISLPLGNKEIKSRLT
jgi:nicotinamidase-related amidase